MKKTILTLLFVSAFATTASALSFQWGANSVKFGDTNLKSSEAVTGYLIYLGSNASAPTTADISSDTISTIVSSIGTQVDSKNKTSAYSKLTGTYTFDFGSKTNGDTFGMLLAYADSESGKTYYNLSSSVYKLSGIVDESSSVDSTTFAFDYATKSTGTSASAGGGWVAVPEPSTAALALAGLALLLKRRKA